MGLDLVGATAGVTAGYSSNDRVGPSKIRQDIETNVREIMLKYVFQSNNSVTRTAITSEVSSYLQTVSQFLDKNYTNITCDSTNNTDNSATITIEITVKPLISSDEFVITVATESA